MSTRGWVEIQGISHYVLKDKSLLCNQELQYKDKKSYLKDYDPFGKLMSYSKRWCPECKRLYLTGKSLAIEDFRLSFESNESVDDYLSKSIDALVSDLENQNREVEAGVNDGSKEIAEDSASKADELSRYFGSL